jgi:curved DNA-binding protein CbpA
MPDHEPHDRYYDRLGVGPAASQEEIVHAYRRLAHGAHPDTHPEDPEAPRRFREITEAYEVLADPTRRARYDRARDPGLGQVIRVVVHRAADPPGSARGHHQVAGDVAPVRLGATGRTGDPPLVAGPVRIESHGEDLAEGPLDSGGFTEGGFLRILSEMLDSFCRR